MVALSAAVVRNSVGAGGSKCVICDRAFAMECCVPSIISGFKNKLNRCLPPRLFLAQGMLGLPYTYAMAGFLETSVIMVLAGLACTKVRTSRL